MFSCDLLLPRSLLMLLLIASSAVLPFESAGAEALPNFPREYLPRSASLAARLASTGNCAQALEEISHVVAREVKNPERIYLLQGVCLQTLERHREAIPVFRRSLKLRPADTDAQYFLAQSLLALGQVEEALQLLKEAEWFGKPRLISLESLRIVRARALAESGDLQNAQALLQSIFAKNQNSTAAREALFHVAVKLGNKLSAIKLGREIVTADPNAYEVKVALAGILLQGANRSLQRVEISEAEQLASTVLAAGAISEKLEREARLLYIRALIEGEKFDPAGKILADSLQKDPQNEGLQKLQQQLALETKAAQHVGE